jgi:hypothetical protein
MAHFAQLDDNNTVIWVTCIDNEIITDENGNESEELGIKHIHDTIPNSTNYKWKQTSYNNNFRGRYAGIGFSYDEELDAFIGPQIYPSWTLNVDTFCWEPPVPKPEVDENSIIDYHWNEESYQSGNGGWFLPEPPTPPETL